MDRAHLASRAARAAHGVQGLRPDLAYRGRRLSGVDRRGVAAEAGVDGGRGRDAALLFAAARYAGPRTGLSRAGAGARDGLGGGSAERTGDLRRDPWPGRCLETFTPSRTSLAAREAEMEDALGRTHLRGGGHARRARRTRTRRDAGLHQGLDGALGQRLLG